MTYTSEDELIDAIDQDITALIQEAHSKEESFQVLLSGGSTPGPIYDRLNANNRFKGKCKLGLIDERFVRLDSEFSNERLMREAFSSLNSDQFVGMVHNEDYSSNLLDCKSAYAPFLNRTNLGILGMGPDGHTASLFPNDSASNDGLKAVDIDLCNTNAPSSPTQRISCNLKFLCEIEHLMLIIFGENKKDVLLNAASNLPIHELLAARPDTKIYYSA